MKRILVAVMVLMLVSPAWAFKVISLRENVTRSGSYVIKVWNTATTRQSYQVSTGIWHRDRFGRNVYEADERTRSCEEWVTLPLTRFALSPGESKEIPYSIKIPRRLKVTHVAMVWITSGAAGKGSIQVRKRIGIKIFADPRRVRRIGKITGMRYEEGTVSVSFLNQGNVELKLDGWVRSGGEEKIELPLAYILPERERVLKLEVAYAPEIEVVIEYGGENLAGGRLCEKR